MGYQNITDEDAAEGFNVVCPTFTTAGVDLEGHPYNTVVLSDVALTGDSVKLRTDNLQIFDVDGNAEYLYQWRADGWYDPEEGEYVNETVLDRATGFIIDSYNGDITIRSNGQVCTNSISVAASDDEGFNVVGNPFPVDLTLADIALSGENVKLRTDNLQIFDQDGNAEYLYQWRSGGWYDPEESEYVNETAFPSGLGVIIDSANGGIDIEISAPASLANL